MSRRNDTTGIDTRTGKDGIPRHRGRVWDRRAKAPIVGQWTPSLQEAQHWRDQARIDVSKRHLTADRVPKLTAAIDVYIDGMLDGTIHNRSGRDFKPSAIRGYRTSLHRAAGYFGAVRVDRLTLPDLQLYVDYRARHAAPSTVHNDVIAMRALYGWVRRRHHGIGERDPFKGLQLPRGETARDRVATPEEMALLIAALHPQDRALLAVAALAGLRRGEALALDRDAILPSDSAITVRRAWDPGAGKFIEPKTPAAVRRVPIVRRLAVILEDHLAQLPDSTDLLFPGRRGRGKNERPMSEGAFHKRARERWKNLKLQPIGLHEARHTYASIAIAAGVNAKTLCTYMGHSSITVTFDRYGHLMPGNEDQAVDQMDAYLEAT